MNLTQLLKGITHLVNIIDIDIMWSQGRSLQSVPHNDHVPVARVGGWLYLMQVTNILTDVTLKNALL